MLNHKTRRSYTSHGDERPVQTMICSWMFCLIMPAATFAWYSTKRIPIVVGASLMTPALAILQGAIEILTYRNHFGDAPLPQTPSHGVVVVHPDDKAKEEEEEKATTTTTPPTATHELRKLCPQRRPIAGLSLPSLGCECTTGGECNLPAIMDRPHLQRFLQKTVQEPPLRILVLGDSLAIGVGQRKSCTPIMPEVLAKTLSKQLGGRVVYWTCHGSPGASAGWIVRELERGVMQLSERNAQIREEEEEEELDSLPEKLELMSNCSDTDESSSSSSSSSDASSSTSSFADARHLPYSYHHHHHHHHHHGTHFIKSGVVGRDDSEIEIGVDQQVNSADMLAQWKERLAQHRKRLDHPDVLGPYDIVVVLTGSNDLKGACFPFLLKGEDAEFRRQAKLRGGNYTKELRRLFETVNDRMQKRLQNIVHKVEVATESVRERMEETLEYIAPGSSHRLHSPRPGKRSQDSPEEESSLGEQLESDEQKDERHLPLVVLPGLPARSLPIFRSFPLRWLSVPAVDIMDMHKRNFSKGHPGEVLFVPAPSVQDLVEYEEKTGEIWRQRGQEDTLLALRDTRKRDCRRIEGFMRKYYESRSTGYRCVTEPPAGLFSIDGVHPSDDGYDFWGRYIGNHVAKELQKAKKTL